jgi:hypothetical protein
MKTVLTEGPVKSLQAQNRGPQARRDTFYLIMHEHLFVFRKPRPREDLARLKYSKASSND